MKIFIVDDDAKVIKLIIMVLEAAGHEVASDTVSSSALDQILEGRPDCVITDLMMTGMDGLALIGQLRAQPSLREVKIVMVSAKTNPMWEAKARDAGADGFIGKPLDVQSFAGTIEKIVGGVT